MRTNNNKPSISFAQGIFRGFTLIELLVVISIVAIFVLAIGFGVSPHRSYRALDEEAQQLAARLQLFMEEATFQGELLGVVFYDRSYAVLRWREPALQLETQDSHSTTINSPEEANRWALAGRDAVYQSHVLPQTIQWTVEVEGVAVQLLDSSEETPLKPHILLLPSGELTSFDVRFSLKDDPSAESRVFAQDTGEIKTALYDAKK